MNDMINESEEDLFELKYLEEIAELFNEFIKLDNYYGLNLLKDNYCEFYEFMDQNIMIYEFSDEEEEISESE